MFFRDFAIAVGVGAIILLLLSRLITRLQFSLSTAFWCSFIGHAFLSISAFLAGIIAPQQQGLAFLVSLVFGCLLQAGLFQVAVRAKGETLVLWRAILLSGALILADVVVASPMIAFGEQFLGHEFAPFSKDHVFLGVAIGLGVMSIVLRPLGDGLLDTSMWVAKILAPLDAEENDATKQLLKFSQAALLESWLSNVPFSATVALFLAVISGFVYRWWAGIAVLFLSVVLGVLVKMVRTRSVDYYLALMYHKMANRAADYRRQGDLERLDASESLCEDLANLIVLYQNSGLRPPTPEQLNDIPYGDLTYWLEQRAAAHNTAALADQKASLSGR
jgi:hypothetical protein